jgi:hypothetical protein
VGHGTLIFHLLCYMVRRDAPYKLI